MGYIVTWTNVDGTQVWERVDELGEADQLALDELEKGSTEVQISKIV